MTAGRLRYVVFGEKRPKTPAFRLQFQGGAELILTEAGKKKRAGVWLLTPEAAELELGHLGPEANEVDAQQLGELLAGESRRLHSLLRDQRVIAGIGRALGERDPARGQAVPLRAVEGPRSPRRSSDSTARSSPSWPAASSSASEGRTTSAPTGFTASSPSRASCAARRSRKSTSRSTRSTTARTARPAAACSGTGGCRACCGEAPR